MTERGIRFAAASGRPIYRKSFLTDTFIFDSNYTTETMVFYAEFIFMIFLGAHTYKKFRKILPDVL